MVYWEVESQDKNKGEKDMTQQKGYVALKIWSPFYKNLMIVKRKGHIEPHVLGRICPRREGGRILRSFFLCFITH